VPGFPIRTPWDHSLVDSSPRPIAASHVLHRLLVPRHPPFALDNLTTKMLASTVQFSTNDQPTTRTAPHQTPTNPSQGHEAVCDARSCLEKKQPPTVPGQPTPPGTTKGCSLRTQQGAHHPSPAAPHSSSFRQADPTPKSRACVLKTVGRCQRMD
jgi:hypothetical protein